jgi:imidazolonepropionase-like amidohydrolase
MGAEPDLQLARVPRSPSSGPSVIGPVTVIDGNGGPPRRNAQVLIADGRISAIAEAGAAPEGHLQIDGGGGYLIPGLWDTHVHVSSEGGRHRQGWLGAAAGAVPAVVENLESYLDHGVTTVVDLGGRADVLAAARARDTGARMLFSGGHFNWPGGAFVAPWMNRLVGTIADAEAEVDRAVSQEGIDLVKIVYSAGLPSHAPAPKLSPEVVHAIAARAHRHGLTSATHGDSAADVLEAIEAGVGSTEHMFHPAGPWRDDRARIIEACLRTGTWWPMTIILFEAQARARDRSWLQLFETVVRPDLLDEVRRDPDSMWLNLPEVDRDDARRRLEAAIETAAIASDAGVAMTIGTDAGITGIFHGPATHRELELHAAAGVPERRIIEMATSSAARRFGRDDALGSIGVGKQADLVLLAADPLDDISNTRAIAAVIQDGAVVRRSSALDRRDARDQPA